MRQYEIHYNPLVLGGYYVQNDGYTDRWVKAEDYEDFENRVKLFKADLLQAISTNNFTDILTKFQTHLPGV